MNIAQYRKYDISNGPGVRINIFVSGCTHNCKNCFNKEYHDFNYGFKYNEDFKNEVINDIDSNRNILSGVSILGGEPFQQIDDNDMIDLLKAISSRGINIWIYSGYLYETIILSQKMKSILELCDILVDGPFVENLKDLNLKFKGSSNQRIIDIKQSLKTNKAVLWSEDK